MKTTSIMVQNLCVPCECHCRYCLLSWDSKTAGISWDRGAAFGKRFINEAKALNPDISYSYAFGYSMEHPALREAIRFLREIGSPTAEFMQCDGMKLRDDAEYDSLMRMLKEEGIKSLNFTFYGLEEYHDRFAGRKGDFKGMLRMIKSARKVGLDVSVGIPVTSENVGQVDELIAILNNEGCEKVAIFIPHEEGRGKTLLPIRLKETDLGDLSERTRALLNRNIYRTEKEWISDSTYEEPQNRALLVSLTPESITRYEKMSAQDIIAEIENLDEKYYTAFPTFRELIDKYGDITSDKLYRQRDLFYHYRQLYAKDNNINIYDVTDERYSGSRRY